MRVIFLQNFTVITGYSYAGSSTTPVVTKRRSGTDTETISRVFVEIIIIYDRVVEMGRYRRKWIFPEYFERKVSRTRVVAEVLFMTSHCRSTIIHHVEEANNDGDALLRTNSVNKY